VDEPSQDPTPPAEPAEREDPPPSRAEAPEPTPPAQPAPVDVLRSTAGAPADAGPPEPSPPTEPVPVAVLPAAPPPRRFPARSAPPAARPAPPRSLRDFLPIALITLAAVATFAAGFLPLFRTAQMLGDDDDRGVLRYTQTGWSTYFGFGGEDGGSQPSEPLGVALLAAAVVLLVALVFVIRQVVTARASAAARGVTLSGAAFLAGVVLATAMAGIPAPVDSGRVRFETSLQAGMWLLFLAVVAAAAAAVLDYLASPGTRPDWADPGTAYADTPTPPSGVAITVLPPEVPGRG
jgi:hypothetical protein